MFDFLFIFFTLLVGLLLIYLFLTPALLLIGGIIEKDSKLRDTGIFLSVFVYGLTFCVLYLLW
jgi:hypothetical protein